MKLIILGNKYFVKLNLCILWCVAIFNIDPPEGGETSDRVNCNQELSKNFISDHAK
jgi:hypothetical protein